MPNSHVAQTQRIALSFVVISEYYCHPMSLSSSKRETPQVALPNDAHCTLQVRPRPTNYDLHFMTEKRGRPEGMFCTKEKGKVLLLVLMNEREVFLSFVIINHRRAIGMDAVAEWQALPRPWHHACGLPRTRYFRHRPLCPGCHPWRP